MWFSKCFKLSKKQYEEARNEDKKDYPSSYWNQLYCYLQPVKCYAKEIKTKFGYFPLDYTSFNYGDDEYGCYRKIKDILLEIGDGWLEIDNEQTYYNFGDKEIKANNEKYNFTELENGDLVVWHTVKEKSSGITAEYTHTERYNPGRWTKIVTTSPCKVSLIPSGYDKWVDEARMACKLYEEKRENAAYRQNLQ